jgi:hypothetical protein
MSKTRPKKSAKPDDKLKSKESDTEKKGDKHEEGEQKPQPAEEKWSDWIWDEGMKLYYRAKPGNGGELVSMNGPPPILLINGCRRMGLRLCLS